MILFNWPPVGSSQACICLNTGHGLVTWSGVSMASLTVALGMFPTKKTNGWRAWIKGTNFSSPVDVFFFVFSFPSLKDSSAKQNESFHPSRKKMGGNEQSIHLFASSVFCSHLVVPPCEALISQDEEILLTWPGWSCRRGFARSCVGWDGFQTTQTLPRDLPGLYWATGYFLQFGASSFSRYPHN